jgi:hypothetical protein
VRLCADYKAANPLDVLRDLPQWEVADAGAEDDSPPPLLQDVLSLPLHLPAPEEERLTVSAGAAALLASVIMAGHGAACDRDDRFFFEGEGEAPKPASALGSLRLEPPLLATDPDADVRVSTRRWEAPLAWYALRGRLRTWPVDERAGEGFAWPQGLEGFCRRAEEGLWREKVSVCKGATEYLMGILAGGGDGECEWEDGGEVEWVGFLS